MPQIGLDNLYFAELDEQTDVVGSTAPTYKAPFKIAKAIEVTMTPTTVEASLYADDATDEYEAALTGYELTLNVNDLLPNSESKLLGKKKDANGAVLSGTSDEAPYGALMFRQKLSKGVGGGYRYRVLYKTRFTPFAENAKTKGESVEYQTPSLSGKALPRIYDGQIMIKIDDNGGKGAITGDWFDTVYEPSTAVTP